MKASGVLTIVEADPQGPAALALLREAAIEARALYPELQAPDAPWPTNPPTPAGGVYLIGYDGDRALACGALRPLQDGVVEVRRMYVAAPARRQGLGNQMLRALERSAARLGYVAMRLETGYRQLPAIGMYLAYGFERIEPFGPYVNDPTSVCFEKRVDAAP